MSASQTKVGLTVVCLLFGIALMVQFRTESRLRQVTSGDSTADLEAIAGSLYDSNSALRQEVDSLLAQRSSVERAPDAAETAGLTAELQRLRAFNGDTPVSGPGVEIVLDADIRPVDVLDLVNELRNAGAEAIAIGDQRVVFNTGIGGTPGHLLVNQTWQMRPTVIEAIGAPEVLDRALARKGGLLSYLRTSYPHATITLQTREALTLPAFTRSEDPSADN